jgi:hypothetical protein
MRRIKPQLPPEKPKWSDLQTPETKQFLQELGLARKPGRPPNTPSHEPKPIHSTLTEIYTCLIVSNEFCSSNLSSKLKTKFTITALESLIIETQTVIQTLKEAI